MSSSTRRRLLSSQGNALVPQAAWRQRPTRRHSPPPGGQVCHRQRAFRRRPLPVAARGRGLDEEDDVLRGSSGARPDCAASSAGHATHALVRTRARHSTAVLSGNSGMSSPSSPPMSSFASITMARSCLLS